MKESTSFKDVVKRVLVTEKPVVKTPLPTPKKKHRSKYIEEAIGTYDSSNYSPGNLTPASNKGGWATGMPPFSKYTTDKESGQVDMRDIGKAESIKAKDVQRAPYPLETVLDFIAHSGEDLNNAKGLIEVSLRKNDVSLTPEQKNVLKNIWQILSSSLGNIVKAAKSIGTIKLS